MAIGSLAPRYRSVDSASTCSAARDSAAGAVSSIDAPLRFLPTPLPAGFFTFFLFGWAFFEAFRAAFFSTFVPVFGDGFFSTFARALPLSLASCEFPIFVCNCPRNSMVRRNSFSNFSSPSLRRDFLITFLTRPTRLLLLLPLVSLSLVSLVSLVSLSLVSLSFAWLGLRTLSFIFAISYLSNAQSSLRFVI